MEFEFSIHFSCDLGGGGCSSGGSNLDLCDSHISGGEVQYTVFNDKAINCLKYLCIFVISVSIAVNKGADDSSINFELTLSVSLGRNGNRNVDSVAASE